MRSDAVGRTAQAVNSIVHGESASMVLPLGGQAGDLTIQRVGGSEVKLDNQHFSVSARLPAVPGREEIRLDLGKPIVKDWFVSLSSFPSHIRIFQAASGNIVYGIDRAVRGRAAMISIDQPAGNYVFARGPL